MWSCEGADGAFALGVEELWRQRQKCQHIICQNAIHCVEKKRSRGTVCTWQPINESYHILRPFSLWRWTLSLRMKSQKLFSKPLTAWLKLFWLDHQTFRKEKRNRNKVQLQIWKIISLDSNKNKTFQILEMSTIFILTAIKSFWPTYFIKHFLFLYPNNRL